MANVLGPGNCGNLEDLRTTLGEDELAMNHPLDHESTTRCLEMCGGVQKACTNAILDPERGDQFEHNKAGEYSEEMSKAATNVRVFLTATINPLLIDFKKEMARLAAEVNDMIDSGAEITREFREKYNNFGRNSLVEIINLIRAKSVEPGNDIFYKGFLRMLAHRLISPITTITAGAYLDLEDAASGKFDRGRFPDHYANLRLIDLSDEELVFREWPSYFLADSSVHQFELNLKTRGHGKVQLVKNWQTDPETSSHVRVHEKIFAESLEELLGNAARSLPPENGTITTSVFRMDGHMVFSVADTGHGIPSEILPKIFDDGFTTKQAVGGTGKGLALVKTYIESIGGRIEVESAEGKGSTFRIILPVAKAAS